MAPAAISWYSFTQEEKNDLEHSWNLVEGKKNHIACDIYEMIFNQVLKFLNFQQKLSNFN